MSIANTLNNGEDGKKYGSMLHPWLKTQEYMIYHTPSRRDGMTYEEEMSKRQQGGRFVFDVVMCLTHGKGENGQMGVAITLLNRFFNVHSFKIADFRDVAAACVFLAGKNEDTPKKLKYVVNQLWQIKYPHQKQFPSEAVFQDVCNVVTYLEEIVLKTVAFDINVDLPHQHVLKLMRDIEKGRNDYKEMVKTAYYMATDILLITDWSVRYSCHAMASACINIAAFFHKLDMDNIVPLQMNDTWYRLYDKEMKRKDLDSMTKEFLTLFAENPHLHIGSLQRIDRHGLIEIKGGRIPPEVSSSTAGTTPTLTSSASSSNLQKKLDIESYKGRQKTQGPSESTPTTSTRPSFLPDVKNQKVVEEGLKEQKRQQEMQRQMHQQRHHGTPSSSSSHRPSSSSSSGSSRSHHHNHQRQLHDDAQKRPMPRDDQNGASKKPRIEDKHYISFVASSSTTTTTSKDKNGCISSQTTTTNDVMMTQLAPPPVPPPVPLMSVPIEDPHMSQYAKMFLNPQRNSTPAAADNNRIPSTHHHAISSTEQISPPDESSPTSSTSSSSSSNNNNNNAVISSSSMILPPPPPPPVLPPLRLVEEIEDGELV